MYFRCVHPSASWVDLEKKAGKERPGEERAGKDVIARRTPFSVAAVSSRTLWGLRGGPETL